MPHAGELAAHRLTTLSERRGGATSCQRTVVASIGMATAQPGRSVADTVREADASMYAAERARRGLAPDVLVATPAP